MLDNWQRIEKVIKWTGKSSISAFAREIGLNRSENLYQIKRGNNGISKDLAESITVKYPAISKAWLITGEGEMLPSRGTKRYDIPFFKTDASDLVTHNKAANPEYHISFPMYKGCEFAAFTLSDAMSPEIPKGSVLFLQSEDPQALIPGETYLVSSKLFTGVRILRKEPESNQVKLVPTNSEKYDSMMIEIDKIEKLYLVRGILITR